jgi:hypothetical protein
MFTSAGPIKTPEKTETDTKSQVRHNYTNKIEKKNKADKVKCNLGRSTLVEYLQIQIKF